MVLCLCLCFRVCFMCFLGDTPGCRWPAQYLILVTLVNLTEETCLGVRLYLPEQEDTQNQGFLHATVHCRNQLRVDHQMNWLPLVSRSQPTTFFHLCGGKAV